MNEPLHRLIYYSRKADDDSPTAMSALIEDILAASRRNNAKASITGALMFSMGCFGQVLEGTQSAIEATFERIQCDPRHTDVSVLEFAAIERRAFEAWSMGYVGNLARQADDFANVAERSGFDPSRVSGEAMVKRLCELLVEDEVGAG